MARAAGNDHLAVAFEDARADMFHPIELATFEFVKESSHAEHARPGDAFDGGDGPAAGAAMRAHLEHTRVEMLAMIEG